MRRKGLKGRGATPKAVDRPNHSAHKRAIAQQRREETREGQATARNRSNRVQIRKTSQLVAGRNPVAEVAAAHLPIRKVFILSNPGSDARLGEIAALAARGGAPIVEVTRSDLDQATGSVAHQGIAVEVPEYEYADLEDIFDVASRKSEKPLIVALDGVTDPHNLGAAVRSAAAFGAHGVVIPSRRSASMTVAAWKTSAGAATRIKVARVANLHAALTAAQEQHGCFVVGLDMGGTEQIADTGLAEGPIVLVTGSEGTGLSRLIRDTCDMIVSIPISSAVESLNASVATGIVLNDVARLRRRLSDN